MDNGTSAKELVRPLPNMSCYFADSLCRVGSLWLKFVFLLIRGIKAIQFEPIGEEVVLTWFQRRTSQISQFMQPRWIPLGLSRS
jgi:hypothetical protein